MNKLFNQILFVFLTLLISSCQSRETVRVGLDRIAEYKTIVQGKRVGIITNHTAYNSRSEHITQVFASMPDVQVVALFSPEHGIRGTQSAGEEIESGVDSSQNIPLYSLYGETRKPTAEMLRNLDMLVFDIQDIGSRYYTYIYTMALAMEAAAEVKIPFVVLDRPNPINGIDVEGNLLEPDFATFVGLYPIPVRHGMTVAELALMINEKGWLKNHVKADLKLIPLANWKRDMWFDQTGLLWRPPSPNMPDLTTAILYPGTCLFEGTNISEGRGTYQPFLRIGAPWYSVDQFSRLDQILDLTGVHFGPIIFTPISIPGMSPRPKFQDQQLTGILINLTDRQTLRPYLTGIALVKYFYECNKEKFIWRERHFDRLCGTDSIRQFIQQGKDIDQIKNWIDKDRPFFLQDRLKYLLY